MKVEHFGIYAHDTESLAGWYQETLGFTVVRTIEKEDRPPIFFLATDEGGEIELLPTNKPRVERKLNYAGFSHIGLIVDDFEKTERMLREKGVILEGVRKTSNGWMIGYFEDPEGNVLEIVSR